MILMSITVNGAPLLPYARGKEAKEALIAYQKAISLLKPRYSDIRKQIIEQIRAIEDKITNKLR